MSIIFLPMSSTRREPARCPHCNRVLPEPDDGRTWTYVLLTLAAIFLVVYTIITLSGWTLDQKDYSDSQHRTLVQYVGDQWRHVWDLLRHLW